MLLVEYSETPEGRRVIEDAVGDVLSDVFPVTPQAWLNGPERLGHLLGAITEAYLAGFDGSLVSSVYTGEFDRIAAEEPFCFDDDDLDALAEIVRPFVIEVFVAKSD